jgi:DNA invertase Pin-like site-specific DNA recombinase
MLIGYARVSALEQDPDIQEDAREAAGCKKVHTDKSSGTKPERTGLEKAPTDVRPGDSPAVRKLDRLGRSLKQLIETVTELSDRGVGLKSSQEALDTMSSAGKLVSHVFGALAELERDIIRERTLAGLAAGRAREGGGPAPGPRRQEEAARRDAPRRPDELRPGHPPGAGDLTGNARSISGRAATPMIARGRDTPSVRWFDGLRSHR